MTTDGTKEITQDNAEAIKKAQDEVKEVIDLNTVENIINNNEIKFDYLGKLYKVTKPTTEQKNDAYKKIVTRYIQLLQESLCFLSHFSIIPLSAHIYFPYLL